MLEDHMYLQNLNYAPLETSLIGCIKGITDYFGMNISTPWIFGTSGHAFLMNIHAELCPSGPYCWNYSSFLALLGNIGIKMVDLGFFHQESTSIELKKAESIIKSIINGDNACIILNLENQLVVGYNEHAFIMKPDFNNVLFPSSLTFGSWKEFHPDFHATVYKISKSEPKENRIAVIESLKYAVSVANGPAENFTDVKEKYMTGLKAYDQWIKAINNGYGSEHGNWWNGTVWSECRSMAANFFLEIPEKINSTLREICGNLSGKYKSIAKGISIASKKELHDEKKVEILKNTQKLEMEAINEIKILLEELSN